MLCCLMLSHQTARADGDPNSVVFQETFDQTSGTGGRDGQYTGSIATNTIKYDNAGWADAVKCGGAYQCVKFGTGDSNGVLTTPEISLGGVTHAVLTFSAAGWGDDKKNKLTITTNDGFTLSGDNDIQELVNEEWNDYTVLITVTTGTSLKLTFTGKRGFLDDVVVRALTTVPAPELPGNHTFFPNTTEDKASESILLTPANYTAAYYTTDGSAPSSTNGTEALLPTSIAIHGTTTVKAIAYVGDMASEVVTRTYTQGSTVNGIQAFNALADGTEARLFLAADGSHETRVLYYDNSLHQLFLRENTKALCVDFGETAMFNPTPQYNQHVAGWVVGKKATENGLPKLVATDNTTTAFLAIANPVTESQTEPVEIAASDLSSHAADWVSLSEQRAGTDLAVSDRFGTGAYDKALVDLSGIVVATSPMQVAPVTQNGTPGVVYVVDENADFYLPDPENTIENATVRLKRTLSKDYWNTFAVPFEISGENAFDANIREFDSVEGNTMVFKAASKIEAGVPYLVKPSADIVNPTYSNVTLKYQPEKGIVRGDYKFVATYAPKKLATDKTELFLTTTGKLGYPETDAEATLKGMRAYFVVPQNASPSLFIDDNPSGVIEVRGMAEADRNDIYNLNGQRVTQPGKGLYIVNGKKLIIH